MRVTRRMEKQALKRAGETFGKDWLKPIASALPPFGEGETHEEHSMDRWMIVRGIVRMEDAATKSLERSGFECWYPKGKLIKAKPLRHLPSKTRHKRAMLEVVETNRAAYPGYLLVRRMFGDFEIGRFYELPGVVGVCCFGDVIATVPDHEVEIIRVDEARGAFDQFASTSAESAYFYQLAKKTDAAAEKPFTGQGKTLGRACESQALVTFRKTLDRITRVITEPPVAVAVAR